MNREYVEVKLRQARYDFLVENWPPHLQRASKIERKLLELMPVKDYQIVVDHGSVGTTVMLATKGRFVNGSHPVWRYIEQNKEALIAWVEHTDEINARIERLTAQLREMEATE